MTIATMNARLALFLTAALISTFVGLRQLSATPYGQPLPHGCATGNCSPKADSYGHYQVQWRRWPGATTYEGVLRPKPQVDVPEPMIPNEINEGRTEPRTRSDKPLDDAAGGGSPSELVPFPNGGTPNPFDNTVPNTDLPDTNTNSFDGGFGVEAPITPDPAPNTNPGTAPFDPLGPDPIEPEPEMDSDPDADLPLIDFGLAPMPSKEMAVRSIRSRALALQRDDDVTHSNDLADVVPTAKAEATVVDQVSYEEGGSSMDSAVSSTPSSVAQAEDNETNSSAGASGSIIDNDRSQGNPLRRGNAARATPAPILATPAPSATFELKEVVVDPPSTSSRPVAVQSRPAGRSLASSARRSLPTLRKNPLR